MRYHFTAFATDKRYLSLINKDSIAKMKQNVVIINCARGGLMKMEDLIEGIENKKSVH